MTTSDTKTANELTKITRNINLLDERRKRLIDSYANGKIDTEKYVAQNKAMDTQQSNLESKRKELSDAVNARSESSNKYIKRFCANAKTQFNEADDFESQQQFFQDHIEKIIFTHGHIAVIGSIPIKDARNKENTSIPFRIEGEIDSKRSRIYAKRTDKQKTRYYKE